MINGIACFAADWNDKICEKSRTQRPARTKAKRTSQILRWREDWSEEEFQKRIRQLIPTGRIRCKGNFCYLADNFKKGETFDLVSAAAVARAGRRIPS
jgi:anthranilate/para-aminobenzoate synthase component I